MKRNQESTKNFFLKKSKKWPKFDEKISKFYFSQKRAEVYIWKHQEIDSGPPEDSESVESGLLTSKKFNLLVLAYVRCIPAWTRKSLSFFFKFSSSYKFHDSTGRVFHDCDATKLNSTVSIVKDNNLNFSIQSWCAN